CGGPDQDPDLRLGVLLRVVEGQTRGVRCAAAGGPEAGRDPGGAGAAVTENRRLRGAPARRPDLVRPDPDRARPGGRAGASPPPIAILRGMGKFRGTVRRSDLEGGHWQLEAEDGTTYVLEGTTGAIESDGAR